MFKFQKSIATNETTTLHLTICTRVALENKISVTNNLTDMIFDDNFYLDP